MSRPLRIVYPGAWYHVMNRGAAKQNIFCDDEHREMFLNLLDQINNRYQVEIHAYALMDNHYHLLIRTLLPNISRAMRHIDGVYTQYYNKAKKRDGALLRGRYKAIIVDAENYLLRVSRYIHLNPVVAGLSKKAEQYRWSSYRGYLIPALCPRWLRTSEILDRFGGSLKRDKYRLFVQEGVDKEVDSFINKLKKVPILGCDAFIKTVSEKVLLKDSENNQLDMGYEISHRRSVIKQHLPCFDRVLMEVANFYNVSIDGRIIRPRRGSKNLERDMLIYLASTEAGLDMQTIADNLGQVSYSAVSKSCSRVRKQIQENDMVADQVASLVKLLRQNNSQFKT